MEVKKNSPFQILISKPWYVTSTRLDFDEVAKYLRSVLDAALFSLQTILCPDFK